MKFSFLDPRFQSAIKLVGIFCLITAGFIYGEYKFLEGRQEQCLEGNGFLMRLNETIVCVPEQELNEKGWEIDYKEKKLFKTRLYELENNFSLWN